MFKKTLLLSSILSILLTANISAHPKSDEKQADSRKEHKGHREYRGSMEHDGMAHDGMKRMHRAFAQLDLSEQQKASLEALKEANKDTMKASHQTIKSLKEQMRPLLEAEVIDENAVKNLTAQIADLKAEQMIKMASLKKQAIGYLTEEQKMKLEEMKEKRENKRKERYSNS